MQSDSHRSIWSRLFGRATEEKLAAARREGFERGYQAGQAVMARRVASKEGQR